MATAGRSRNENQKLNIICILVTLEKWRTLKCSNSGYTSILCFAIACDFQGAETAREAGSRNSASDSSLCLPALSVWLRIAHKAKRARLVVGALRFLYTCWIFVSVCTVVPSSNAVSSTSGQEQKLRPRCCSVVVRFQDQSLLKDVFVLLVLL